MHLLLLSFPLWPRLKGTAARLPAFHFPGREWLCVLRSSWRPAPACWRLHLHALSLAGTSLTHVGWQGWGRPQRAEGREEAGRALPPEPGRRRRQGAGETDSDLSRELSLPGLAERGRRRAVGA